eukprot:1982380-Amphidinium_carterae.1
MLRLVRGCVRDMTLILIQVRRDSSRDDLVSGTTSAAVYACNAFDNFPKLADNFSRLPTFGKAASKLAKTCHAKCIRSSPGNFSAL